MATRAPDLAALVARHRHDPTRLVQLLRELQEESGWISPPAITQLAGLLGLPRARVEGVAGFYSFFATTPRGDYRVLFSDDVTDRFDGNLALRDRLCAALRVAPGALREDGRVSVGLTSCTGLCEQGPALLVNERAIARLTPARIDELAALIEAGTPLADWPPALFAIDDSIRHEGLLLGSTLAPGEAVRAAIARGPDAMLAELLTGLTADGHAPIDFYPEFVERDDPTSGFERGFPPPRFSTSYGSLRNRFSVLVETHSWRPYGERVKATWDVTRGLVRLAARDGVRWRALQDRADRSDRELPPREVVLAWGTTAVPRPIEFLGYAYERGPSALSGKPWIRYDDSKPQSWTVPLREALLPRLVATVPAGYVIPAAHAARVGALLQLHGFTFERLDRDVPAAAVEAFRATEAKLRPATLEGRPSVLVTGAWAAEPIDLRQGSLWVPTAQPGVRLLVQLLEPQAPDSIVSWGGLAAAWEPREYVEDYLLESFARELLAKDPAVKAAFEAKLKEPAFAADPTARLGFFHERHPARDRTYRLYPILRAAARPGR